MLSFLNQDCDIFSSDFEKITNTFPYLTRLISELLSFHSTNCCASHKSALRRFPHRVRHWTFVIDRTHFRNNTTCHAGYNIDEFPQLKNVNSQQAEQINRSLRSLATVLAHYKYETYLKVLELFFVRRNMRMQKQYVLAM